ncbi:conserved hypothetical protein [Anaeromyxobacter dehalogenans 2CP-1]|uniref:Uncharacterized protein n=1 Tax=Anaeromyxobacter dehalogenans (strain ATCC BAA-258 / DSM 21875 / 2CP-1) TaxID=455488 RepID=B8JAH6_ANAD2|nr:hypothetical protein [Anaeromyxobacter dehalogenans]ACL67475.1 conserved hypothetical protein [Anaeromyxobacter dehalogenans 2CP-1]
MEPKAFGTVLALLVDPAGKPVRGGAVKGQLHVLPGELVILRPRRWEDLVHRIANILMIGSLLAVIVNVFTWRSMAVVWGAVIAQGAYWLALPFRRRLLEPVPLTAAGLDAARRAGRVAIRVEASKILEARPPEPPKKGFRQPARLVLPEGALEMYLSESTFEEVRAALGR